MTAAAYPVMLDLAQVMALVVGAGSVGERRALALHEAGAHVTVVSPRIGPALEAAAAASTRLVLDRRAYRAGDVGMASIVVAATDAPDVNAAVAAEARALGRLVNVADVPEAGNFWVPAVHRAGDVVVAVTASGVPAVAMRIRDAIAARFDARYASVTTRLQALRRRLIDAGRGAEWREASAAIVGDDFCARVEDGTIGERVARWG